MGNNTYRNCILLIAFLCLSSVVKPKLLQIQQRVRNNNRVSFLAVGDWGRKGGYNQSLVAQRMGEIGGKLRVDLVISTGDNFYKDGLSGVNDSAFEESFSNIYTARSLQKPWYAILGNHDYHGNTEAELSPLLRKRDRRWNCHRSYILRAGNCHRNNPTYKGLKAPSDFLRRHNSFRGQVFFQKPNKFNWKGVLPRYKYLSTLVADLKTALKRSNATWKIVVGHHPIRSIGYRGDTVELLKHLLPILQANRVPIYINGHDHCLEHINNTRIPIEFLTSGGGSKAWSNTYHSDRYKKNLRFYYDGQGFISVQLTRGEASVSFYDVSGKILHNFRLKKYAK